MRKRLYTIIFESDTWSGKFFDLVLIVCILLSIVVVMLDSVQTINEHWGGVLWVAEWAFTLLFSLEYLVRLYCSPDPKHYATGFFGVVDVLSVLPTYVSLLVPGTQYLMVIRVLRVLRIFRILKFVQYVGETDLLLAAFYRSRQKITVFLFSVLSLTVIFGSLMYVIEFEDNSGFTSIPTSIYWAIVTMTTVGYGDISPMTPLGQLLAAIIMIMGYSIIAVPGGIITANMLAYKQERSILTCSKCKMGNHDLDAKFCKKCGEKLIL